MRGIWVVLMITMIDLVVYVPIVWGVERLWRLLQ